MPEPTQKNTVTTCTGCLPQHKWRAGPRQAPVSLGRTNLVCPRKSALIVAVFLCLFLDHCMAQTSLVIKRTIKEQLLPGAEVAALASDPGFIAESRKQAADAGVSLPTASSISSGGIAGNSLKSDAMHFSVLASGNANARYFGVDERTGKVTIREELDREQVCSYRLDCVVVFEVAARSLYGSFFLMVRFVVTVTDINDNYPEFLEPRFELNVPEESDAGRRFPLPTAFDRDTGPGNGVKEYRMLQGSPIFQLETEKTAENTTDVFLRLNSVVNRETSESYKILVGAIDGGLPSLTGTLTVEVHISDINDNFPVFGQSVYTTSVAEDFGRDHPVTTVSATDADTGSNGELVYVFSAQQPQDNLAYFRIDSSTGNIYLSQSIESRTGQLIELIVEARDKGHPPKVAKAKVEVLVMDTVNSMPTIVADPLGGADGIAEVSEYAKPGKVVAHISVQDPDSGPNGETQCQLDAAHTSVFGLVSLDNDNSKFTAVLRSNLDREATDMYNVTVTCRDSGVPALLAKERFAVRVLDENDEDPVFDPRSYAVSVPENNTVGATIVQLSATDKDIGINAELTYDVAGINSHYFTVNSDGLMTALTSLDREESALIVATVLARDGGNPTRYATATVVVTLTDVNDMAPKFDTALDGHFYRFKVDEGLPAGMFVGIVSASDDDIGNNSQVFYSLPGGYTIRPKLGGGGGSPLFQVNEVDGVIKTTAVLDREQAAEHTFHILAIDKGSPPLTGTATVVIQVGDVNDNDPVFELPLAQPASSSSVSEDAEWENETVSIPHTWNPAEPVVTVIARDKDEGLNARIVYTLSSTNGSVPFSINPDTGTVKLDKELSADDVGLYFLTLAATDQGPLWQRSTQAPLYVDVFFDNSTLLFGGASDGGPSQAVMLVVGAVVIAVVLAILLTVVVVCVKRSNLARKTLNGGVPNSASTSSTAKLQGGYYIAPGVRDSTDSILANKSNGTNNGKYNRGDGHFSVTDEDDDEGDGMRTTNPYVVMLPRSESNLPSEIIEISRTNGGGLSDASRNAIDLDAADDSTAMFSTFKSEEDILSPGFRSGSLKRQSQDTCSILKKRGGMNDTFDDTSNEEDDSTSDSGRGGSEVDINNGAAALANKEKARMRAATPLSVKSGISNRLSPLPRLDPDLNQRTMLTFRGESPSSFRFDSDNDTLTKRRANHVPSSPSHLNVDPSAAPPSRHFDFNTPQTRLSESDGGSGTDSELGAHAFTRGPRAGRYPVPRRPIFQGTSTPITASAGLQYPNPQHIAGIYSPNVPGGDGVFQPSRHPARVPPLLPVLPSQQESSNHSRPVSESESQLSDASSSNNQQTYNGPGRSHRGSLIPRLPYYPNIEFSHHAYGGSNRNSIGAFSNASANSDLPPFHYYHNNNMNNLNSSSPAADYQPSRLRPRSDGSSNSQAIFPASDNNPNSGPDPRVSINFGNVVSELQESRPVSMEVDMLLPPYPEVDDDPDLHEDLDNQLNVHSGYTGFSPHKQNDDERRALFESSA